MISVAALMPTIKSHRQFVQTAVRCFAHQKYPSDWQVHLVMDDNETDSLGKKLNRLCSACVDRGIDYIVLWDDDDWFSKDRIFRQGTSLLPGYRTQSIAGERGPFQVSGSSTVYYQDGQEAWQYKGDPSVWLYGLAFSTKFWETHPFEDISKGVDTAWLKKNVPAAARFDLNDPSMSIARIHNANTCRKHPVGPQWPQVDYEMVKAIMEEKS